MAEFGVFLRQISRIDPIPDADRIEVATVGGYQCVVGRGTYTVGQMVLYIPEDAILPDELIAQLGLEGRLAGRAKNRVKAVKLRGVLSQGLVMAVDSLMFREEVDHAERLGITKHIVPVPVHFAGKAVQTDGRLEPWVEVDAVKSMREFDTTAQLWNDPFAGYQVEATLKVHGTAFSCTLHRDGDFYVSSKGMGRQGIALLEDDTNVYWRAVHEYDLRRHLADIRAEWDLDTISLYGEVYGPGVQDLTYGLDRLGFAGFDLKFNGRWRAPSVARLVTASRFPWVPAIYVGPYNYDRLVELANTIGDQESGFQSPLQEGLVIRVTLPGKRLIGKIVSDAYLLRKNGTEYN